MEFVSSINAISAGAWDSLEQQGNPFLRHGLLAALEDTGCVSRDTGWQPHHGVIYKSGRLLAAIPGYIKSHSMGEFVFDWDWADAYFQHGLAYYPKLLSGVPFSPVSGPRLLIHPEAGDPAALRRALAHGMLTECKRRQYSSWHLNFPNEAEITDLQPERWQGLRRFDWQFHWINRDYGDFSDFLRDLSHKKRKNIRQERRKIAAAGIQCRIRSINQVTDEELDFAIQCQQRTFLQRGHESPVSKDFFYRLQQIMPDQVLLSLATDEDQPIAAAIFLRGDDRLFGRYWGSVAFVPGLHFELCYYQGIQYCIENRLRRFEPGAQGEHKIARGFSPVKTHSLHYIHHPAFREAIRNYLQEEARWLADYKNHLQSRLPFRHNSGEPKPQNS